MQLFTSEPITNNYKSKDSEAVKAMTAHRSTAKTNRTDERQKSSNPAVNAMDTPSTAEVIRNKRKNRQS